MKNKQYSGVPWLPEKLKHLGRLWRLVIASLVPRLSPRANEKSKGNALFHTASDRVGLGGCKSLVKALAALRPRFDYQELAVYFHLSVVTV